MNYLYKFPKLYKGSTIKSVDNMVPNMKLEGESLIISRADLLDLFSKGGKNKAY